MFYGLLVITFCALLHLAWSEEVTEGEQFEGDILVEYNQIVEAYGEELAIKLQNEGYNFFGSNETETGTGKYKRGLDGVRWNNFIDDYVVIPYTIDNTQVGGAFSEAGIQNINRAMRYIEDETGVVKFVNRTTQSKYFVFGRFRVDSSNNPTGCWSTLVLPWTTYVGQINLGSCETLFGSTVHELLHQMGVWHEQARADRDSFIDIVWDNIIPAGKTQFGKRDTNSLGSSYDFHSLMHYPLDAFPLDGESNTMEPKGLSLSSNQKSLIGQRGEMSYHDKEQIRAKYQCQSGSRDITDVTSSAYCTNDCKCWKHARGSCNNNDNACKGNLVCRLRPSSFENITCEDDQRYNCDGYSEATCRDYTFAFRCPRACNRILSLPTDYICNFLVGPTNKPLPQYTCVEPTPTNGNDGDDNDEGENDGDDNDEGNLILLMAIGGTSAFALGVMFFFGYRTMSKGTNKRHDMVIGNQFGRQDSSRPNPMWNANI